MNRLKILFTFIPILLLVFCTQTASGKNEKEPSSLNKYFSFCIIGNDQNSSDPNMWGATISYDNDSGEILNLSKTEIIARSFGKGFRVVMILDKNNNLLNSLPSIVPKGTGVFFRVIVTGTDINPPHISWKSADPSEKSSVNIAINPNNPAKRCNGQLVTGSISANSIPAGAHIWINGRNTNEITPFVFSNLLPGSYEIIVKKQGYYDEERTVNLFPGDKITLEFQLREKTGNLEVSSVPAGAEIWLNGQNTGYVTPYTILGLDEGSYTIVCKLAGYLEKSKSVEIIAGQTASLSFELEKDYKAVTIPAGCFYMGDHIGDGEGDEKPVHLVCISPFQIRQYETTNIEYKECVDSGKCSPPAEYRSFSRPSYYGNPEFDEYPVIYVGWYDAKDYCDLISMRLPTEAEWEFAARGKLHGMKFPYGNTLDKTQANYDGLDTIKVGSLAPNGYGLYDMSGNVWEWVNDWYSWTYYRELPQLTYDPQGPDYTEVNKVLRGGSYVDSAWASRVAHRHRDVPTDKPNHRGIRCAKSVTTGTGTIFVTSIPRGAEIYLNGVKMEGLTPNNITGLTPNLYVVECELNGQRSEPKDVSVEADKAVPVVFDFEETEQMVAIPTGSFTMGAVPGDTEIESDEVPAHLVYITKPFKMDKLEVTNGEYNKCVEAGWCTPPFNFSSATRTDYYNNPDYSDFPVIYVSWYDATDYCSWKAKRLPTEAEWEYAARGGKVGLKYPNGNTLSGSDANFWNSGDSEDNDTTEVGSYKYYPNNWELYDMVGNVYEWIQDWYEENYYSICPNPAYDPQGPANSSTNRRCLRGGSWAHNPRDLRISDRGAREPDTKQHNYGFRCAR